MGNNKNIEIEPGSGGIKCDNCDFKDDTVLISDWVNWIDKPCPKCGENLLTKEDFDLSAKTLKVIDFINGLSEEDINKLGELIPEVEQLKNQLGDLKDDEYVHMTIHGHKDKLDIKIKPTDENGNEHK